MDDPDKVLTVGEAAKLLGVGPKTLSAMVRSGKVPGFRIGERGYWRIKRRDIDKLMDPQQGQKSPGDGDGSPVGLKNRMP
ncbi:MAG: helix-turn-helix domain-containing protein [Deltaproteobacteria bacterium]|jgi:excisionase family DNA binding protein|nr:helix-turn-helix domain-containing protein [Deltaproteobacteria bacterium]